MTEEIELPDWHTRPKLWLDSEHYIRWVTYKGERIGGILGHRDSTSKFPEGWCEGAFHFEDNEFFKDHPRDSDQWKFNGNFEQPTLTPSFLCHCKLCHIFITDGKVIDAGCKHNTL